MALDLCHSRQISSLSLSNSYCGCRIRIVIVESTLSLSNLHRHCRIHIIIVESVLLWSNPCRPAFIIMTFQPVALLNLYRSCRIRIGVVESGLLLNLWCPAFVIESMVLSSNSMSLLYCLSRPSLILDFTFWYTTPLAPSAIFTPASPVILSACTELTLSDHSPCRPSRETLFLDAPYRNVHQL